MATLINPPGIKYIVVHCSATRPSQNIGRKEIDRMHRLRGFFSIGYHYVIRRDGTVEEGRKLDQAGAHAVGYNSVSWGVCLVGGVTEKDVETPEDNFTADQYDALGDLLTKLKAQAPQAVILGHRDLPKVGKACPSFSVREWLKETAPWLLGSLTATR